MEQGFQQLGFVAQKKYEARAIPHKRFKFMLMTWRSKNFLMRYFASSGLVKTHHLHPFTAFCLRTFIDLPFLEMVGGNGWDS